MNLTAELYLQEQQNSNSCPLKPSPLGARCSYPSQGIYLLVDCFGAFLLPPHRLHADGEYSFALRKSNTFTPSTHKITSNRPATEPLLACPKQLHTSLSKQSSLPHNSLSRSTALGQLASSTFTLIFISPPTPLLHLHHCIRPQPPSTSLTSLTTNYSDLHSQSSSCLIKVFINPITASTSASPPSSILGGVSSWGVATPNLGGFLKQMLL